MVTGDPIPRALPRAAVLLLSIAARRWPAARREELAREWSAELHAIAADGRRWEALWFAASLAASRPAAVSTTDRSAALRFGSTVGVLLVAPFVSVFAFLGATYVIQTATQPLIFRLMNPGGSPYHPLPSVGPYWSLERNIREGVIVLVIAVGLSAVAGAGLLAGGRSALIRPKALAVGVVAGLTCGIFPFLQLETGTPAENYPALALATVGWAAILATMLWRVAMLARNGRQGTAWVAGIVAVLLSADLATTLAIVLHRPAGVSMSVAFLWFPSSLSLMLLVLPFPFIAEWPVIRDLINYDGVSPDAVLEMYPAPYWLFLLLISVFALTYVIGAARRPDPALAPATVPVPPERVP